MPVCWSAARERSVAILATLHVGIEPVLLTLLVATGAISPADGGWVVGAGQLGMSAGAMMGWRSAVAAKLGAAVIASLVGIAAALALAIVPHLSGVLLLRVLLGGAMGLLLVRATAAAARTRPHRAIGVIILGQQLLATTVMVVLPLAASSWGAATALASLAIVPLIAGVLVLHHPGRRESPAAPMTTVKALGTVGPWTANLVAMALLIAVTLMIWSYVGAIAARAGVTPQTAEIVIAITSLASAPAALFASLVTPRQEPWLTASMCGVAMLMPLLLPPASGLAWYVAAMVAFNAGSAFAMIRFSAWTMEGCAQDRERRSVVVVQCIATAGGAPLGAVAMSLDDLSGLTALAACCTCGAIVGLLAAQYRLAIVAAPSRRMSLR